MILETDALQIKHAFYSNDYDATSSGGLISEMKFMVQVNFHWFKCDFVPRECNRVAHVIAASGYECEKGFEQIMSSLPAHINVGSLWHGLCRLRLHLFCVNRGTVA